MAFDAGMFAACIAEINASADGARVEKVYQPEKEEIVLMLRTSSEGLRLSFRAGANSPRFGLTSVHKENPEKAPMFCMLLRKHIAGARFLGAVQQGFERAAEFSFSSRDEMGFASAKTLVMEIMGTYSNLILLDESRRILGALKTVDLTDKSGRAVLPGLLYEKPPAQSKQNPLELSEERFFETFRASGSLPADKFIMGNYMGISPLVAREIAFAACGATDAMLSAVSDQRLFNAMQAYVTCVRTGRFRPVMITARDGKPIDYTFIPVRQYGADADMTEYESFGALMDAFFGTKERTEHLRQRSSDILKVLTAADTRLRKKIQIQKTELEDCRNYETLRKYGELITANVYRAPRGADRLTVTDYYDPDCPEITIPMDARLTAAENAQRYYKKYNKQKVAQTELAKQIASAESELSYIDTVFDALTRAACENDLAEIRQEMEETGYGSRMKRAARGAKRKALAAPLTFRSTDGLTILCGRNNIQNDTLTLRQADRNDYWFHVKNAPGSHVILVCDGGTPTDRDMTEAAEIAAFQSSLRGGSNIPVDYTKVRYIKKPAGSRPGFVTYSTNSTAYVTPEETRIRNLSDMSR